jgi:ABC-type transporter Mla subunit MlaD
MMNILFKKITLAAMILTLAFVALPVTSAFAADENPPVQGKLSNERLERIWARELKTYERLGRVFDHTGAIVEKAQKMIDKAAENGKDVSALQAALDAFEAAIQNARPQYNELTGVINTHAGFDAEGKVTDGEQARSTVKEVGAALKEIRSTMGGTGKAFREAVRAFREANKPVEASAERDS